MNFWKIFFIVFGILLATTLSIRYGVKLYRYLDNAINPPITKYELVEPTKKAPKKRYRDTLKCLYGMKMHSCDPNEWTAKPNETISGRVRYEIWNRDGGHSEMYIIVGFIDENAQPVGDTVLLYGPGVPGQCQQNSFAETTNFEDLTVPKKTRNIQSSGIRSSSTKPLRHKQKIQEQNEGLSDNQNRNANCRRIIAGQV
jgi:hypothetical protein